MYVIRMGILEIGMYRMLPSEHRRMRALVTSNRVWKDEGLYGTGVTETVRGCGLDSTGTE
jgi:hypothetical protein